MNLHKVCLSLLSPVNHYCWDMRKYLFFLLFTVKTFYVPSTLFNADILYSGHLVKANTTCMYECNSVNSWLKRTIALCVWMDIIVIG